MKFKKDHFDEDMREQPLRLLIPVIVSVLVIVILSYVARFYSASFSQKTEDWGTLGDYFGGLMNPVISFATLMVAYAVWKLQKSELHETKLALKEQATTAELQRQEQRFFDLMQMYQQSLNIFSEHVSGYQKTGKAATSSALLNVHDIKQTTYHKIRSEPRNFLPHEETGFLTLKNQFKDSGDKISRRYAPYFRIVFRILSDAEKFLGNERYRFIRIFRAQLNEDELFLLGAESIIKCNTQPVRYRDGQALRTTHG